MDDLARFHSKWIQAKNGCKIWQGKPHPDGYGQFRVGGRQGYAFKAHRWIFIQMFDFEPEVVMHKCDNRLCVNWEGCLIPGTRTLNMVDKVAKGRQSRGEAVGSAKLTETQVREIRQLAYGIPGSYREIGLRYGVSPETIYDILKYRTWRHCA
ncbi:hypothetical protein ACJ6WD_09990 [Streptomyces sp. VTCC 41912]|uniref:hypothetical protein n=1 Tax=Streptomyces sp. VTCC 41912 TaxID=3383243 RepID=UPI003896A960